MDFIIQVYLPKNQNYTNNGDMVLTPSICGITCEINGLWQMVLEHPIDSDERWKYIQNDGVIKAKLFDQDQLFVIRNVDKTETEITVEAEPIFMNARDEVVLLDVRPTNQTAQNALNTICKGTKYKGITDITTANTAYYVRKNLIEAIQGDDENSFLNRWGGEVFYNDFTIHIEKRLGNDNGYQIAYARNIAENGFNEKIDTSNVITRIYPIAYNGHMIQGTTQYVDSPLKDKYPTTKAKFIQYSHVKLREDVQGEEENIIICENQEELNKALRDCATKEWNNGLDKPSVTININMAILKNNVLYEEFKHLEHVSLGDTVHCTHSVLGIDTTARIIKCTYDSIRETIVKVTIGDFQGDYIKNMANLNNQVGKLEGTVNSITDENHDLLADKIKGVIDLLNVSLIAQKDIAQKQDVRAILFEDLDPNSPTFGALCIGTQGIQISKQRNLQGTDWKWGTAINFESIVADYIATGVLSDKQGKFSLNMETGQLKMKDGEFTGKVTTNDGTIGGWTINENGFTNGKVSITKDGVTTLYTLADLAMIQLYIMEQVKLSESILQLYDFDGDGEVSPADYVRLQNKLLAIIPKEGETV